MKWALLIAAFAASAGAVNISVQTTADSTNSLDGITSLREAVIWANTNSGLDTIELPAGLYVRTISGSGEDNARTGDLDITDDVIILGEGADNTIIDAAGLDRVMFLNHDLQVTLMDLTLRGGYSTLGSGIYNESTTHVVRCNIESNEADFYGGGIYNYTGNMFLEYSTVKFNFAGSDGGGGVDVNGGTVIVSNSTVSGNFSFQGGGMNRDGGTLSLYNSTVAFNEAVDDSGGVFGKPNAPAMGIMANTIVANNTAPEMPDLSATVTSLGYNLIGVSTGASGFGATDLLGTNALLGALQNNGGTTPTHALLAGSPAINRAQPGLSGFDQRGLARPRGRGPDIGALEEQAPDEDVDGIPDEWEMQYGLNPTNNADATSNPDADGFNNLAEYIADTNPTNGQSFHHLAGITRTQEVRYIFFPSSSNRVYQLQQTTGLVGGAWSPVGDFIAGAAGGATTLTDTNVISRRSYGVNVKLP